MAQTQFMANGSVDVERYQPVGAVQSDSRLLEELFADVCPA